MIDVRKLRMLAALERLGTIAAVAEELHLTPPGVSMQLSALEKELGIALTQRHGRRVVLTAAGTVLAAHGHDIVDRLSLAERELVALRAGSVGHYTLAAFPSAARTFVTDAYRRILGDDGSGLDVHLRTLEPEAALDALATGSIDVAVIHSYSNVARDLPSGVVADALGTEPVRLAVRAADQSLRDGRPAQLSDYSDVPWITPTPDVTCFSMVERACGIAGFRPRIVAETLDFAVQLHLVAAGVGVALVPELTVDQLPDGVELRTLATPVTRALSLAVREPSLGDPGIRNLSAVIADAAATLLHERALPSHA